jgi:hypothetical protein
MREIMSENESSQLTKPGSAGVEAAAAIVGDQGVSQGKGDKASEERRLPGDAQDAQPGREDVEAGRNALRIELAKLAGSLLCARGGTDVTGPNAAGQRTNRIYGARDAVGEAALLLALAWSPTKAEAAFATAAVLLGEPTIWPED